MYRRLLIMGAALLPLSGGAAELQEVTAFVARLAAESNGPTLVLIPAGEFMMGGASAPVERPGHKVTISRPYFLGTTEVTQAQWVAVMGSNPAYYKGDTLPVESVSHDDALAFCAKLTERERAAGRLPVGWVFTLPTEAQWEYAARAGTTGNYGVSGAPEETGWYSSNSGRRTHPVAGKRANAWGLYDMHGNVWEWCLDWFGKYARGAVTDPAGPSSGKGRNFRGGGWVNGVDSARSSARASLAPDTRQDFIGFRLALSPVP